MMKYFSTDGRINRFEFFISTLVFLIIELVVYSFDNNLILWTFINLVFYSLQSAKRYHDLNLWGINGFIWYWIPILNIYFFLKLLFDKGSDGDNKYGKPSTFSINFQNNNKHKLKELKKGHKNKSLETLYFEDFNTINPNQSTSLNIELDKNVIDSVDDSNEEKEEDNSFSVIKNVIFVSSWKKKNGEYLRKGEKICKLMYFENNEKIYKSIYSNEDGFLIINKEEVEFENFDEGVSELFEIDTEKNINIPIIDYDRFEQCDTLRWSNLGAISTNNTSLSGFLLLNSKNGERLFLSINYIGNKNQLIVNYPQNDYSLKKGNRVQVLLETDEILSFTFANNSYFSYEFNFDNIGKVYENKTVILHSDIEKMSKTKIIDFRLILDNNLEIREFSSYNLFNHSYKGINNLQDIFKLIMKDYLRETSKLKSYKQEFELDDKEKSLTEKCYVYLMVDLKNNAYKIGISNSPKYRERTLQSEKPSIELIISKQFPSRRIARSIENALHKTYEKNRIRGEWFTLDEFSINEIKETLK